MPNPPGELTDSLRPRTPFVCGLSLVAVGGLSGVLTEVVKSYSKY
jgi:hypothetical protein